VLFVAHEFQETCCGWTSAFQIIFVFHFSCGLISFGKTQLKNHIFLFVSFSQAGSQITDLFSPLSAHAQHCDNSEPQTDPDRRSWFFDGTFIRNSQKKSMEILHVFGAKIKFFFISSLSLSGFRAHVICYCFVFW
jgi:hypothetical protein